MVVIFVASVLLVILVVGIHFECLNFLNTHPPRLMRTHRWRISVLIVGAITAHMIEIVVIGLGMFFLCTYYPDAIVDGEPRPESVGDYIYFAATCYTTIGFGDMVPEEGMRFLASLTGVTGLVCITWTASLTYLQMERSWQSSAR